MKKLILVDPKTSLCEAWQKAFANYPEVEVYNGRFEEIEAFDCMVSAANSFGLMDGGVDLAISNYFGYDLQSRVQERILTQYNGEQPVGTSFIVETNHQAHPYVAHTPTMRVPMPINGTDNVYLAMKALLQAVKDFNAAATRIQVVLCPGLGTATGQVPNEVAAEQMALAYAYHKAPPHSISWAYAAKVSKDVTSVL